MGEKDEKTALEVYFLADEPCKVQCTQSLTAKQIKEFKKKIKDDYFVQLNADDMPLFMPWEYDNEPQLTRGLPLGTVKNDEVYLFNHWTLKILYHKPNFSITDLNIKGSEDQPIYRIVGFQGQVHSKDYASDGKVDDLDIECAMVSHVIHKASSLWSAA